MGETMKTQRIHRKLLTLEGLCFGMTTLLWDIENCPNNKMDKFHTIVELAEVIYHKILEVKSNITNIVKAEEQEELRLYLEQGKRPYNLDEYIQ